MASQALEGQAALVLGGGVSKLTTRTHGKAERWPLMSIVSRRAVTLLLAAGASALLLGCASSTTDDGAATPTKTGSGAATSAAATGAVAVELSEWAVKASGPGKAGEVKFNVKNTGSIPHEFVILK